MPARQFDKLTKEKFLKYSEKVETYLNKQEGNKANSDFSGKLEKMQKLSERLSIATKAQLNAINVSAQDIKQQVE